MGAMLLPQSYQYPNLSEGADRVGEQLRGDRERPFSDVTKSGRVWRKVPESDSQSVRCTVTRPLGSLRCDTAEQSIYTDKSTQTTASALKSDKGVRINVSDSLSCTVLITRSEI